MEPMVDIDCEYLEYVPPEFVGPLLTEGSPEPKSGLVEVLDVRLSEAEVLLKARNTRVPFCGECVTDKGTASGHYERVQRIRNELVSLEKKVQEMFHSAQTSLMGVHHLAQQASVLRNSVMEVQDYCTKVSSNSRHIPLLSDEKALCDDASSKELISFTRMAERLHYLEGIIGAHNFHGFKDICGDASFDSILEAISVIESRLKKFDPFTASLIPKTHQAILTNVRFLEELTQKRPLQAPTELCQAFEKAVQLLASSQHFELANQHLLDITTLFNGASNLLLLLEDVQTKQDELSSTITTLQSLLPHAATHSP